MSSPRQTQLDDGKSRQRDTFWAPASMPVHSATYSPRYTPPLSFSTLDPASKGVSGGQALLRSFQPVPTPVRAYGSPPTTPSALPSNLETSSPYFWEPTIAGMDDYTASQCQNDSDATHLTQQRIIHPSSHLNSPQPYTCIRYNTTTVDIIPPSSAMSSLPDTLGTELISLSNWEDWQNGPRRSIEYDNSVGPDSRRASHTIPSSASSQAHTQPPSTPDLCYHNQCNGHASRSSHEVYSNYGAVSIQSQAAEQTAGNVAGRFRPQLTATVKAIPAQYTVSELGPQYMEHTERVLEVATARSETSLFVPTGHPTPQQFESSRTSAESLCRSTAPESNVTRAFSGVLPKPRFDASSRESRSQALQTYRLRIRNIFSLVRRGNICEAGAQLLSTSQYVLGDVDALGSLPGRRLFERVLT